MDSVLIQPKTAKEFYQAIGKYKKIAVYGYSEEVNKAALENKKVEMLINPERYFFEDKMDSRNSGLNDALCKLARDNGIKIAIEIDYLLKLNEEERIRKLGKIMQNMMLCNKYKVPIVVLDKEGRNEKDLKGFALSLGARPGVGVVK